MHCAVFSINNRIKNRTTVLNRKRRVRLGIIRVSMCRRRILRAHIMFYDLYFIYIMWRSKIIQLFFA